MAMPASANAAMKPASPEIKSMPRTTVEALRTGTPPSRVGCASFISLPVRAVFAFCQSVSQAILDSQSYGHIVLRPYLSAAPHSHSRTRDGLLGGIHEELPCCVRAPRARRRGLAGQRDPGEQPRMVAEEIRSDDGDHRVAGRRV